MSEIRIKTESVHRIEASYPITSPQKRKMQNLGQLQHIDRYEVSDLQEEEAKVQHVRSQTIQKSKLDQTETQNQLSLKIPRAMRLAVQQEKKNIILEEQEHELEEVKEKEEVRTGRLSDRKFTKAKRKGFLSLFNKKQEIAVTSRNTSVEEKKRPKTYFWNRKSTERKIQVASVQNKTTNFEDRIADRKHDLNVKKDKNVSTILTTKAETQETPGSIMMPKLSDRKARIDKTLVMEGNNRNFSKETIVSLNSVHSKTISENPDPGRSEIIPSQRSIGASNYPETLHKRWISSKIDRPDTQEQPSKIDQRISTEEIEIITTKDQLSYKASSKQDIPSLERLSALNSKTSIETTEQQEQPSAPTVKSTLVKFVGYVLLYCCIAIVISIITAIIAANYEAVYKPYHLWGQAIFEGFFMAVVIAIIIHHVLKKAECENHLVVYKHYWVFVLVSLVLSPLLSVAFFRIVDTRKYSDEIPLDALKDPNDPDSVSNWNAHSQFFYLLCKLPVVLLNLVIYQIYFSLKRSKHLNQSQSKKPSFFYADIYKNFQEELNKIKTTLNQKTFNRQQRPMPTLEPCVQLEDKPQKTADLIGETPHNLHNVVSCHRNAAVHLIIAVLICQFLVPFGYLAIVRASVIHGVGFFILLGAAFYPLLIGVMKEFAKRVNTLGHVGIDIHVIHLMSMIIAAVSYRSIYFIIDVQWQAICVILIKVAYKIVVYAFYGRSVSLLKKLWEKILKKLKSVKEIYHNNDPKHNDQKKAPMRRSSKIISAFEGITLEDNYEKQYLKNFSSRFALLQIADCISIVSVCVTLGIFNSSQYIQDLFKRKYSAGKVGRVIEFSGIELAFDVGLIVLIGMIMRRNKIFKGLKVLRVLNEILKSSLLVFVAINFMVFYTFYLVFPSYF